MVKNVRLERLNGAFERLFSGLKSFEK